MAEQAKDKETENLIKDTARDLFFKEGKFNATTQEIADAAGVNRTLINYYFRSRNNLFTIIFNEAVAQEDLLRDRILYSDLPFRQKIEAYIDEYFKQAREFPYLESYIVTRLNEGHFYKKEEDWKRFMNRFQKDFTAEIAKGEIEEIDPIQFLLNLGSLISFPFAVRPLFQSALRISDEEYDRILSNRKEVILKLLFK